MSKWNGGAQNRSDISARGMRSVTSSNSSSSEGFRSKSKKIGFNRLKHVFYLYLPTVGLLSNPTASAVSCL